MCGYYKTGQIFVYCTSHDVIILRNFTNGIPLLAQGEELPALFTTTTDGGKYHHKQRNEQFFAEFLSGRFKHSYFF